MTNIYFWGKNISPSFQSQASSQLYPILSIRTDQQVKIIQSGAQNAFILTNNNQLFAFGSNQHGQMGLTLNPNKNLKLSPIFIPTKSKIVSISCGWHHTLILDQLGCVYSSGKGSQGAIGQGIRHNSFGFKQIMTGVKKISAGFDHSLAIKGKKVFGWGNNEQGQLGMHSKKKFLSPQQLNVYPCEQILAGPKYSIFVTVKGVYGCGKNNNFQLGLRNGRDVHYPKNLNIQDEIVKVWGGNYCFAKNQSEEVYIWGTGAFGVFKCPTKIPFFERCVDISLGLNFGIMSKNDKIYVWGSNNFGQLAINSSEIKDYAFQNSKLSQLNLNSFSCGKNFAVAISHQKQDKKTQKQFFQKFNASLRENFDLESQNQQNLEEKSSDSSFHAQSKLMQKANIFNQSAILRQKTNEISFKQNFHKFDKKQQLRSLFCKSDDQKEFYDQTVNKMIGFRKAKKNTIEKNQKYSINSHGSQQLDKLTQQLSEIKLKMYKKEEKNRVLEFENAQLKRILKDRMFKEFCEMQNHELEFKDR